MTVYYARKGGGLGNFLGPLSLVTAFVPGLAQVSAGLGIADAALKGDYLTAAQKAMKIGGAQAAAQAAGDIAKNGGLADAAQTAQAAGTYAAAPDAGDAYASVNPFFDKSGLWRRAR